MDLILKCSVINEQYFTQKNNQFKISSFFEQRKFNLQREENEGYAKLIVEITQVNLTEDNWETVSQNIQKLVGFFSLDPTRVLDLILTAFECNLSNLTYLRLISDFGSNDATTQLIGFKIRNQSTDSKTSANLFSMIALLVKHQVIELSNIWSYMATDNDKLKNLLVRQKESLNY